MFISSYLRLGKNAREIEGRNINRQCWWHAYILEWQVPQMAAAVTLLVVLVVRVVVVSIESCCGVDVSYVFFARITTISRVDYDMSNK